MTNVTRLPERPGRRLERIAQSQHTLARELRNTALSEAFVHVTKHHPEAKAPQEQFDLAVEITTAALYKAAKSLTEDAPMVLVLKPG